jgi:hypothetical protein
MVSKLFLINVIAFMATYNIDFTATYNIEDFYCYDVNGNPESLTIKNKILVEFEDEEISSAFKKRMISRFKDNVSKIDVLENGSFIFNLDNKEECVSLLNELNQHDGILVKFNASPVVEWKNYECVPTAQITFEVQPSVKGIFESKLKAIGGFKYEIVKTNDLVFEMKINEIENPINLIMLANLISEDPWFKWAKVNFKPLYGDIFGNMFVTPQGASSLGEQRQLNIVVDIFSKTIGIEKSLLPQLGEGEFVPKGFPDDGDIWFESSVPKITTKITELGKRITISYPFKYLDIGSKSFPDVKIPYTEGGESKVLNVSGCPFAITSILEHATPEVKDIQPIPPTSYQPSIVTQRLSEIPLIFNLSLLASFILFFCFICSVAAFVHGGVKHIRFSGKKELKEVNWNIVISNELEKIYYNKRTSPLPDGTMVAPEGCVAKWEVVYEMGVSEMTKHHSMDSINETLILKRIYDHFCIVFQKQKKPTKDDIITLSKLLKTLYA